MRLFHRLALDQKHLAIKSATVTARSIIIAEPTFLGLIRKHLSDQLKKAVCFELDKNIVEENIDQIHQYIPKHLQYFQQ